MNKNLIVIGIVIILLAVGLSGCQEKTWDKNSVEIQNVDIYFTDSHNTIYWYFHLVNKNYENTKDTIMFEKLIYVLYGNNEYILGDTFDNNGIGKQAMTYGEIHDIKLNVDLPSQILSLYEGKESIEWNIKGTLFYYTPDETLIEVPVDISDIQTTFD